MFQRLMEMYNWSQERGLGMKTGSESVTVEVLL